MSKKHFTLYKLFLVISLTLSCVLLLESCKKDKDDPTPVPVITDFTPTSGVIGTTVTINGENFSATPASNIVAFDSIPATVSASTTTQITVVVPSGASSGKIRVLVSGKLATSTEDFKVVDSTYITSFSPIAGVVGTTVTITGTNFSTTLNDNVVKFNGKLATVSAATVTTLTVTVPAEATSGKISIEINGQMLTSASDFKVVAPSSITSFSPNSGVIGATVIISGTNFNTSPANQVVKFNGTIATVSAATATQLTVTVPIGTTSGKISIEINGKTLTSANDFTVGNLLAFSSFSPTTGVRGKPVSITGVQFSPIPAENIVKFNGVTSPVGTATSSTLNTSVPYGATTGKISVTVNGNTVTSATDFVIPAPTISGFSPAYGLPGASITVTGTNFATGSLVVNGVKFNGTDATVTAVSETQLTVTVPSGASTGKIKVDVGGQIATSANDFEVLKDIPRDGLVAFYPFKGNANDASGNNLNGTVSGGPVMTTDRFSKANQSYSFDGIDDYINMGNPALLQISNKITIGGWVNINAFRSPPTPGSKSMAIFTKIYFDPNAGGNPKKGYNITQDFYGNGTPSFAEAIYSSSGSLTSMYVGGSDPVTTSNWIFIAVVIDDLNLKFYRNGSLTPTNDVNQSFNILDGSLGDLTIGTYGGGFLFDGKIDDIAIYNRALTAAEVQKLYEQTVTKY